MEWSEDWARRQRAGVPEGVQFRTKLEIALGRIERTPNEGVPGGMVLIDASQGGDAGS